jgi:hypothetical protein
MKSRALPGFFLACGLLSPPLRAADIYVIANSGITLSADEIRDVFTGEKQLVGAIKLTPIDNASAQLDFLAHALTIDVAKYNSLWTKKSFRDGLTAPVIKGSDAEVIFAVKRDPGGIGYVTSTNGLAAMRLKVLEKY